MSASNTSNLKVVGRIELLGGFGTMVLYGFGGVLAAGQEVVFKLELVLQKKCLLRGLWAKFTATNETCIDGKTKEVKDLLVGEEDYFHGGVHDVMLGFGEEENPDATGYLEVERGTYTWPMFFTIPQTALPSYYDEIVELSYVLNIVLDVPNLPRSACTVSE